MPNYIKTVTGVNYTPQKMVKDGRFKIYALPFEKYKVMKYLGGFILFPYYKTYIAKEKIWTDRNVTIADESELYTEKELKDHFHIKVDKGNCLWHMSKIVVTLSDGTKETYYVEDEQDAEKEVAELVKEWGLNLYLRFTELYNDIDKI